MRKIDFLLFLILVLMFFGANAYAEDTIPATYDSMMKRDPLMPLVDSNGNLVRVTVTQSATEMNLQGIVYGGSAEDSYVVLDNEIYQLNDVVGNYKLVHIEEYKVVLSKDNEEYVLELQKEEE